MISEAFASIGVRGVQGGYHGARGAVFVHRATREGDVGGAFVEVVEVQRHRLGVAVAGAVGHRHVYAVAGLGFIVQAGARLDHDLVTVEFEVAGRVVQLVAETFAGIRVRRTQGGHYRARGAVFVHRATRESDISRHLVGNHIFSRLLLPGTHGVAVVRLAVCLDKIAAFRQLLAIRFRGSDRFSRV